MRPDDIVAVYDALWRGFPGGRHGAANSHGCDIAGRAVTITATESFAATPLLTAVSHLSVTEPGQEGLSIHAWAGTDAGAAGTSLPPFPPPGVYRSHATGVHLAVFSDPPRVEAVDLERGHAVLWVDDADRLPGHARYRPATHVLSTWLPDRSTAFVHAAAVGDGDGAVLLVGPGGSGKSTTTLACMQRGLRLLGDDYCLVGVDRQRADAPGVDPAIDRGVRPAVHSLYRTAKLRSDSTERIHARADAVVDGETFIVVAQESMCVRAPLSAVVFVRPDTRGRHPHLARVDARDRPGALLSTGLKAVTGGEVATRAWLRLLHAFDRTPAYTLDLTWDLDAVVGLVDVARNSPVEAA